MDIPYNRERSTGCHPRAANPAQTWGVWLLIPKNHSQGLGFALAGTTCLSAPRSNSGCLASGLTKEQGWGFFACRRRDVVSGASPRWHPAPVPTSPDPLQVLLKGWVSKNPCLLQKTPIFRLLRYRHFSPNSPFPPPSLELSLEQLVQGNVCLILDPKQKV